MAASPAAQIMRQAEQVKNSITESGKPFTELWVQRQKLEDLYKKLLLQDLEYALDKKVEQDLWNHAFKNQISILQTQAKDKENQKKLEAQASLNLFLETASGFYLQFLQMICSTFKLDLPFRRRSAAFGMTQENIMKSRNIVLPKKSSCLYICCHCLVHLGDIARYRQQTDQAQTFYRHAANLSPNNGQPYNQLAILEASRGDKLSTVFYYMRSLAVRHPFPVAATNLEKFYSKLIKDGRSNFESANLTVGEIIVAFLQFEALLHMNTDLNRASGLKTKITSSLASHIKSQSLTAAHLTGIVAIAIFSAHQARCDTTAGGDVVKKSVMSEEEERVVQIHVSFIVKLLETLLQQTPKEDSKAKDFLTLSAIKVTFDWLYLNKDVLEGSEFSNTSLWQDFCKLLNTLQWLLNEINKIPNVAKYADTPLPEDADLRCFQPLEPSYSVFNYSKMMNEEMSAACERDLRCHRLIAHGRWIAQDLPKLKLIIFQSSKSIRTQFSTRKVASGSSDHPSHTQPKSQRQNVAMQTILKKQQQKKIEQEKGSFNQILTDQNKTQEVKNPSGSATATDGHGIATPSRQVGVIPVHHKGNTFKANLPPRLSAKGKSSTMSPRMMKKDDQPSRNRSNSSNVPASTFGNSQGSQPDFPSMTTNPEEYPSLSADNYPALVSQRVASSLVPPSASDAYPNNKKSGWSPFGSQQREQTQTHGPPIAVSTSSSSSLLFNNSSSSNESGIFSPGSSALQYSQRVSPNPGVGGPINARGGGDGRPDAVENFMSSPSAAPQSEMDKVRKLANQSSLMTATDLKGSTATRASAQASATGGPNVIVQKAQQQATLNQHGTMPLAPTGTPTQEPSTYRLPHHRPYNQQQQQMSQFLTQQHHQQQSLHQQRHQQAARQAAEPHAANLYPAAQTQQPSGGAMFDPTMHQPAAANPNQAHHPPTAANLLLSSLSATSTAPSSLMGGHPRDSSGHHSSVAQVLASKTAATTPRGGGVPPRPSHPDQMSGSGSSIVGPTGGGGQQTDSGRMSNVGSQLMTNPALMGFMHPSSGPAALSNTPSKKAGHGNPQSPGGLAAVPQFGPGGTPRAAGPPQSYFEAGRVNALNPYHSHQHYQQQLPQHYQQQQQQRHVLQQQQQHQHHRGPLQEKLDAAASTGLLYKNIPLAGKSATSLDLSMDIANADAGSSGGGNATAANSDFDGRFLTRGPNATQPSNQALTQLLAAQPGLHGDTGRSASFHGGQMASKPDLMGLHPSPHFLEQHNHNSKQQQKRQQQQQQQQQQAPQPQPQSLMNTVIDPPFLQASGEYTLFNSANSPSSWQAPLVPDAAVHRMKPGAAKGGRHGISAASQGEGANVPGMWSNTGPSPLERLIQQQRSQRQGDS